MRRVFLVSGGVSGSVSGGQRQTTMRKRYETLRNAAKRYDTLRLQHKPQYRIVVILRIDTQIYLSASMVNDDRTVPLTQRLVVCVLYDRLLVP